MKVLMITNIYPPYPGRGLSRVVERLSIALQRSGTSVVAINAQNISAMAKRVRGGVPVYDVPSTIARRPAKAEAQIDTILAGEQPDVVHTHGFTRFPVSLWAVAKRHQCRVVHTLHDYGLLCASGTLFRSGNRCEEICEACRATAELAAASDRYVDVVVGVSRHILDRHLNAGLFAGADQEVIPVGVPAPAPASDRIRPAGTPLRLGFLGGSEAAKGILHLLEELAPLPKDGWFLSVAGRTRAAAARRLQQKYAWPNLRFVGLVKTQEYLQEIDLLLVPSVWDEPFGMVTVEALAAGVPVLAAARGGIPEVAEQAGMGVTLYDPDRPGALRQALAPHIAAPEALSGQAAAYRKASTAFPPATMVRAYRRIYEPSPVANASRQPARLTGLDIARAGARRIADITDAQGRMRYRYDVGTGIIHDDYNMLRHLGSTWALLDVAKSAPDLPQLRDAASRALGFALKTGIRFFGRPDQICVEEEGVIKLGGNGLAILALLAQNDVSPSPELVSIAEGLGRYVIDQRQESGDLAHKRNFATGRLIQFKSDYFTGEALFGLMRLYEVTRDTIWLDAVADCETVLAPLDYGVPEQSHWCLYALELLYRYRPQKLFLDHAVRIARHTLERPRYRRSGRSTPVACRSEGLSAFLRLARDAPGAVAPHFVDTVRAAVAHNLDLQIRHRLPDGAFAGGGQGSEATEVRIDYIQHNISAFLAWYRDQDQSAMY